MRDVAHPGAHGCTVTDARGKGHRGVRGAGWEVGANVRLEVLCDETTARSIADVDVLRPEKVRAPTTCRSPCRRVAARGHRRGR